MELSQNYQNWSRTEYLLQCAIKVKHVIEGNQLLAKEREERKMRFRKPITPNIVKISLKEDIHYITKKKGKNKDQKKKILGHQKT